MLKYIVLWAAFIGSFNYSIGQSRRLFLIAGQSNAAGRGDSLLSTQVLPNSSFEFTTRKGIIPLKDPVGANNYWFQAAGTGSFAPAFARSFHAKGLDTVITVHTSKGGSSVVSDSDFDSAGSWDTSSTLFSNSVLMAKQAKNQTQLPLSGIIWCQGEKDGTAINNGFINTQQYKVALIDLIQRFRNALGCDVPFFIVKTGNTYGSPTFGYDQVRMIQDSMKYFLPNVYCVYDSARYFHDLGWLRDVVHYNQTGLNAIGESIGGKIFDILQALPSRKSISFQPDTFLLKGKPEAISQPGFFSVNWPDGTTNSTYTISSLNPIYVTAIDSLGCSSSSTLIVKVDQTASPVNLSTRMINDSSASLRYDKFIGANYYKLKYRQTGTLKWYYRYSYSLQYELKGLLPDTEYEWTIQGVIGSNRYTAFSPVATFRTLISECPEPFDLHSIVTGNNYKLIWNSADTSQTVVKYIVQIKKTGEEWKNYKYYGTTNKFYNFFLNPLNSYEWRVRTSCSSDGSASSAWKKSNINSVQRISSDRALQEEIQPPYFYNSTTHQLKVTDESLEIYYIYNLNGQRIFEGNSTRELDLTGGIYIIQTIMQNGQIDSYKLIVSY